MASKSESAELDATNNATESIATPRSAKNAITSNVTTIAAENTATLDSKYFYEDEIYRVNKNGHVKFGLVVETPETYSGDEEDDDEDLKQGSVRVAWYPEGNEIVLPENKLGLADRTLMPGDIVRRLVPGKDTQRGVCREVNVRADVRVIGTKYVIKNVMSERLRPVKPWQHDGAVCFNSWVGSMKDVDEKAIIRSSSGARIEVPSSEFYLFKEIKPNLFQNQVFYPGNVVVGRLNDMQGLKKLTPELHVPTNKKGTAKFTVESLSTEAVWVHWQCKALSDEPNATVKAMQQPNPTIIGEDLKHLKRINLFDSCMLQLNDRNYLTFSQCDTVIDKRAWKKDISQKYKDLWKEQRRQEKTLNEAGNITVPMSNTNVFDKLKKKFNLQTDNERTGKTKKNSLKVVEKNKSKASNLEPTNAFAKPLKTESDSDWISEEDSEADKSGLEESANCCVNSNEDSKLASALSTCSTPSSNGCSPKHVIARLPYNKKQYRQFKKRSNSAPRKDVTFKEGDELTTEAMLVYSTATVVWQDGTIEENVDSINLYPIHHLDNHEFFPGEYVSSTREDMYSSFHDYGVIQKVDHLGRTAHVKWFTTYTSSEYPTPKFNGEVEVSVYDLKDHADFQYRPGTMVIRVANFNGEDANCTAGQIIESLSEGRLKVWWVDGHISLCWPQDLFEVGQYDHASDDDDEEDDSEDSWETESENSEFGTCTCSPKLSISESQILVHIERARATIERLENIFNKEIEQECVQIMRKLISLYKTCRQLDRMMNTSFFHENNFLGLVARVRKVNGQIWTERNKDQRSRFFSEPPSPTVVVELNSPSILPIPTIEYNATNSKDFSPKVVFSTSSTPYKCSLNPITITTAVQLTQTKEENAVEEQTSVEIVSKPDVSTNASESPTDSSLENQTISQDKETSTPSRNESNTKKSKPNNEKNQLITSAMLNLEKASEKIGLIKTFQSTNSPNDDSGNFSRNDICDNSVASADSPTDITNADPNNSKLSVENNKTVSSSSIMFVEDLTAGVLCAKFCCILKNQLCECIQNVQEKLNKIDMTCPAKKLSFSSDKDESSMQTSSAEELTSCVEDIQKTSNIETTNEIKIENESDVNAETEFTKNTDDVALLSTVPKITSISEDSFEVLPTAPKTHKFISTTCNIKNPKNFMKAVMREHKLLKTSIPTGVWVKVFEDRLDLLSVMIAGPKKTPYEDCMFFFDFQLASDYPKSPPICHYISFCSDRLNPNLYEDGKVCVSLLGTWSGRDNEIWTSNSTLLQVIVSIQGLILVPDPYFNEAGYEKQKGTQQGKENARMYNEMVMLKVVHATTKILQNPPVLFKNIILNHYKANGMVMYERIKSYMELSKNPITTPRNNDNSCSDEEKPSASSASSSLVKYTIPEFLLVPASRGFCLTLVGLIANYHDHLIKFLKEHEESAATTATTTSNVTTTTTSSSSTTTEAEIVKLTVKLAVAEDENLL